MGLLRDALYAAVGLAAAPVWIPTALAKGWHRSGWADRFGRVEVDAPRAGARVLLHCVSVGEVSSVAGLVPALSDAGFDCVVSSTTDTGMRRAQSLFGPGVVVRFPFDWSLSVDRFLDRVLPDVVALVELEVWPNFIEACDRRGIPVVVVGGRISERSEPRYRRLGPLLRSSFSRLTAVGAQSEAYAERFRRLGTPAERIDVTNSLKWDAIAIQDEMPGAEGLGRALGIDPERPLVVAGSTGPGEEVMLARSWPPDVQLLVAPRKPERFAEVAHALGNPVRRSAEDPSGTSTMEAANLFLLDSLGELDQVYSLGDVAIVGRSFNGMGGSNPIEPAALGCATLTGPDHANFKEPVDTLRSAGGLAVVSRDEVVAQACALARDSVKRAAMVERAREVIRKSQGATERTVELIERALAGPADP